MILLTTRSELRQTFGYPAFQRPRVEQLKGLWSRAREAFARNAVGGLGCYAEVFALTSYDVFVDSKKLTSCRVSLAVAIHLAGFDTL